jgi:Bacterial Ig-like domain (group 3)
LRPLSIRQLTLNILSIAAILSFAPMPASATISSTVVLTLTTPATIYFGQNVDGYAQVNSTDGSPLTGTITFYDNNSAICVISTEANATCPASAGANFTAGNHAVNAVYSGDAQHSGSTSNAANVTVLQDTTTTSISSTSNSAIYGQAITFTAVIQGAHETPAGSVRFLDGTNILGTSALSSAGTATLSISTLQTGTHTITATYQGTPNSAPSISAVLTELIQPAQLPTTTTLISNINPAISGQTITFTASVSTTQPSQRPTGTVTFLDGNAILGTKSLDSTGSANFSTSTLASGSHNITASYAGDATTKASFSSAITESVSPSQTASPSFTISASPLTVKAGQSASVMVKISPANGFNQPVQLACTNLPTDSACTFGVATLRTGNGSTTLLLSTIAPHDCGTETSNYSGLPYSTPIAATLIILLLPGKKTRRTIKRLLIVLIAACSLTAITGCGTCTVLGTRPGTYTLNITGTVQGSAPITASKKVPLTVTY